MAKRWYIVHAYSNFEKKVAEAIKERAKAAGLDHLFEEVLVPSEDVIEMRRGRKVHAERKLFPSYVLVKMEMTDPAFLLIKNTPGADIDENMRIGSGRLRGRQEKHGCCRGHRDKPQGGIQTILLRRHDLSFRSPEFSRKLRLFNLYG